MPDFAAVQLLSHDSRTCPNLQVGLELRRLILRLYDTHLAVDGRGVSYWAMAVDPLFLEYKRRVAELQQVRFRAAAAESTWLVAGLSHCGYVSWRQQVMFSLLPN